MCESRCRTQLLFDLFYFISDSCNIPLLLTNYISFFNLPSFLGRSTNTDLLIGSNGERWERGRCLPHGGGERLSTYIDDDDNSPAPSHFFVGLEDCFDVVNMDPLLDL